GAGSGESATPGVDDGKGPASVVAGLVAPPGAAARPRQALPSTAKHRSAVAAAPGLRADLPPSNLTVRWCTFPGRIQARAPVSAPPEVVEANELPQWSTLRSPFVLSW